MACSLRSHRGGWGCLIPHASLLARARHAVPLHLAPLIPTTSLLTPHSSPFKDSGSTPTSSFRAQSRNPCPPALQLGCCDYAQHDGVCRAPLPPSPTPFPVFPHSSLLTPHSSLLTPHSSLLTPHPSLLIPHSSLLTPHPSPLTPHSSLLTPHPSPFKDSGSTPTSSFRAQSRNPCPPALQLGCCDYAQHDGVCRAPLPPSPTPFPVFPHSSLLPPPSSLLTPHPSPLTLPGLAHSPIECPLFHLP